MPDNTVVCTARKAPANAMPNVPGAKSHRAVTPISPGSWTHRVTRYAQRNAEQTRLPKY
ncbi:hypothetical protein MAHJHV51_38380 [Mycobacterium avium subsp. hominissuis]